MSCLDCGSSESFSDDAFSDVDGLCLEQVSCAASQLLALNEDLSTLDDDYIASASDLVDDAVAIFGSCKFNTLSCATPQQWLYLRRLHFFLDCAMRTASYDGMESFTAPNFYMSAPYIKTAAATLF
jgi:hypothetical protein